jgi:nucleoside-diphosphate-sugar epimerase
MPPFVSIIGAGWLGLPLALALKKEHCEVYATTTSEEKRNRLREWGILAERVVWDQNHPEKKWGLPQETEILVVTLPPSLGKWATPNSYKVILANILNQTAPLSRLRKIIFTGSTGIYGNAQGILTEETEIQPQNQKEEVLAEAEALLKQKSGDYKVYLLRFGGLVGPGREPAHFFKSQKDIPGGEIQVNLVHQTDCIGIMKRIILGEIPGGIYNVSADEHPERGSFYPQRAKTLGLEAPTFIRGNEPGRYVSNEKVKKVTGYTFIYPDPLFFPSGN